MRLALAPPQPSPRHDSRRTSAHERVFGRAGPESLRRIGSWRTAFPSSGSPSRCDTASVDTGAPASSAPTVRLAASMTAIAATHGPRRVRMPTTPETVPSSKSAAGRSILEQSRLWPLGGASILDVGCGTGSLLAQLAERSDRDAADRRGPRCGSPDAGAGAPSWRGCGCFAPTSSPREAGRLPGDRARPRATGGPGWRRGGGPSFPCRRPRAETRRSRRSPTRCGPGGSPPV